MKLTSFLLAAFLLLAATALTNAEDAPPPKKAEPNSDHRSEGDQLLRSARDITRVEYSKTGTPPKKLSDRTNYKADDVKGKHFTVADTIYVVGDAGKKAALIAEPTDAADGFAIIVFVWANGDSAIDWYDTLEALKSAQKEVKFGDDAKEAEKEGEAKEGAKSDMDPYALYKKKGRAWTVKYVTKIAGMDDMITYMKTEVTDVADTHALLEMTFLDKDKKAMAGMEPTEVKIEFRITESTGEGRDPETKVVEETITVEAGEFACYMTETAGTKVWTSKEYPGLFVKMEHANGGGELVEFTK